MHTVNLFFFPFFFLGSDFNVAFRGSARHIVAHVYEMVGRVKVSPFSGPSDFHGLSLMMQLIFMLHWINPERAFICILLQNDHGQLRNMWQYFSSLLVAFKAMRNQTSGWTLTTLPWSASSVLPGADTWVRRLVPLDPFAFNLPLPAHVNTALMLVPSRAALRPRRFPYFRLNSAVVKMLMPTKIKDVAKESYKTRRLLRFLLFGLLCSLSLRTGKGKSFFFFCTSRRQWRSRDHPRMNPACGSRGCEVTHSLGLFDLRKEIFSWWLSLREQQTMRENRYYLRGSSEPSVVT